MDYILECITAHREKVMGDNGAETELKHGTYVHSNVEFQPRAIRPGHDHPSPNALTVCVGHGVPLPVTA